MLSYVRSLSGLLIPMSSYVVMPFANFNLLLRGHSRFRLEQFPSSSSYTLSISESNICLNFMRCASSTLVTVSSLNILVRD